MNKIEDKTEKERKMEEMEMHRNSKTTKTKGRNITNKSKTGPKTSKID